MESEARDYDSYPRLDTDDEPSFSEETSAEPHAKADIAKRVVAAIIDAVAGVLVGLIPIAGGLLATAYWLLRDGLDIPFMEKRSIGKQLVKLRPVRDDGLEMDIETSLKRNWMFAFGGLTSLLVMIPIIGWLLVPVVALLALAIGIIEVVLAVTDPQGKRFGDKFAQTMVIEVDD